MTLIVENGTGLANAESYISVADADTYFAGRGQATWVQLGVSTKEAALRLATEYMEETYQNRWAGLRTSIGQALAWPRYNVPLKDTPEFYGYRPYWPNNIVPTPVARACAELAFKSMQMDLMPDIGQRMAARAAGGSSVEWAPGSTPVVEFRKVDKMLEPILRAGIPIVRG